MLNVPAHWRIKPTFADLSPFGAGEHGRALRIVIDCETAPPGAALDLLHAFSARPLVHVFATGRAAQGRIELGLEDARRDALEVRYVLPSGTRELVLPAAKSLRAHATAMAIEHDLDEQEAWRGLVLLRAGQRHQLDAIVTTSPVLATSTWSENARKANVMTAEQACALLGLFLRAHNDFTVHVEGGHSTFLGFEQFYRGAAIAALPDFSDWLGAAWAIWRENRTARAFALLRAIETRLGRALVARDYVNVRIRHWRPDESWDEVLYFFESFLLSLNGALDALARLFDVAVGLSSDRGGVGFRKKHWRENVVYRAPGLANILADGSHFRAVVDLVAILRNFIHGEVLSAELLSDDGAPHVIDYGPGLLALKGKAARELSAAVAGADGAGAWGIEDALDGATTVMPIAFQYQAVSHGLRAIREAMATEVLVAMAPRLTAPFARDYWLPGARHGPELCLLAGLSDGGT